MSEKDKKIIETVGKALKHMGEAEKDRVLSFAEGMAFMKRKEAGEFNVKESDTSTGSSGDGM